MSSESAFLAKWIPALVVVATPASLPKQADRVMVMVAARELNPGVPIQAADLIAVGVPPRQLPDGVFLSPKPLIGQCPQERILANELV